jgi:hypothetical protein
MKLPLAAALCLALTAPAFGSAQAETLALRCEGTKTAIPRESHAPTRGRRRLRAAASSSLDPS